MPATGDTVAKAKTQPKAQPGDWTTESTRELEGRKAGDVVIVLFTNAAGDATISISTVLEGKSGNRYLRPGFAPSAINDVLERLPDYQ